METESLDDRDNDYYKFLNVSRNASETEIREAFKKKSIVFHPDKHTDPVNKKRAELYFSKLSKVYNVLTDGHKRAIYDTLGEKGLNEQEWTIVKRVKTPQEIREDHENFLRKQREQILESKTNPTSNMTMSINAADLFEENGVLEITEVSLAQSILFPLTQKDNVVLGGNVNTRNGTGIGNVSAIWTRYYNDRNDWFQFQTAIGNSGSLGCTYHKRIFQKIYGTLSGSLRSTNYGITPNLTGRITNILGSRTVGHLSYSSNLNVREMNDVYEISEMSNVAIEVMHNRESWMFRMNSSLGLSGFHGTLSFSRLFEDENKSRVNCVFKAGTSGAVVKYGVQTKISEYSTIGATMIIGFPLGVSLRLTLNRSTQSYNFPILLSDELCFQPILYGTLVPLLCWYTFKKLVLEPIETRKQEKIKEKEKAEKKEKYIEEKKEALLTIELLKNRYSRIQTKEAMKNGLVIVMALYGKVPEEGGYFEQREDIEESLDSIMFVQNVTIPLQCLVEDSKILLDSDFKSNLPGFYSPVMEKEECRLFVRYLYQNNLHVVFIRDNDPLKIPDDSHRLSSPAQL